VVEGRTVLVHRAADVIDQEFFIPSLESGFPILDALNDRAFVPALGAVTPAISLAYTGSVSSILCYSGCKSLLQRTKCDISISGPETANKAGGVTDMQM
jgi:hypothetical protein